MLPVTAKILLVATASSNDGQEGLSYDGTTY